MITINEFEKKYSEYEFNYMSKNYRVFDWIKNDAGQLLVALYCFNTGTLLTGVTYDDFLQAAGLEKYANIKNWYKKAYPGDEYGDRINADLTFADLIMAMYFRENCYQVMGVYDSVIRERVFHKCAELFDKPYNDIYELWLGDPENKQKLSDYGLKADIC